MGRKKVDYVKNKSIGVKATEDDFVIIRGLFRELKDETRLDHATLLKEALILYKLMRQEEEE